MKALFAAILASALVVTEAKSEGNTSLVDLKVATMQEGYLKMRDEQADLIRQDAGSAFAATQVKPLTLVQEAGVVNDDGEVRKHKDSLL